MALLTHSGLGTSDLTASAIRLDISDFLAASLQPENNFLGNLKIGPEWSGQSASWVEDRLNPNTVISTGAIDNVTDPVNMTVTALDGSILDEGYILADETAGGIVSGEQLIVQTVTVGSPNYTIGLGRAYGGTGKVAHGAGAQFRIISTPTYQNSSLGRDMSRGRLTKTNLRQAVEINVNIAQEVIQFARDGYSPGVDDELFYQFQQRTRERLRDVNQALLYSRMSAGTLGGSNQNDYSTCAGLTSMLDGSFNSTSAPVDYGGAPLTDQVFNDLNKAILRQGGTPDWALLGVNGVDTTARIYNDRVRIEQSDETRGFKVKWFDTTAQNSLRILYDQAVIDSTPNGVLYILDSGRICLRPFSNALFYIITAPTFNDGDAVRALMKFSFEARNTGTDVGFTHIMATGLTLT